ncbi:GNAT family N-acetyltransferase, partial [Vibrio cholerae]|uniref:GNAT family N-acetyltransferase n=1 Tax=Vibrio cholerae TaxID=666 RepID=UPI0021CCE513
VTNSKHHRSPYISTTFMRFPCIARLAVDDRYKGKGFGEWLLIDALRKLLAASDSVAFPIVIVDAKDGAKHFYERYGFQAFQDAENKLFFTIADIRASLG